MQIDRDIPAPGPKRIKYDAPPYPFDTMCVGDSFHVEGRDNFEIARSRMIWAAKRYGRKFRTRLDEDRDGGRIWRVE